MNSTWYSWAHNHHYLINGLFICIFILALWTLLCEKQKRKLFTKVKKCLHLKPSERILKHKYCVVFNVQSLMLLGVILVNVFSCIVYDDYYLSTQYLSIAVSIVQVIAVVRIFIANSSKQIYGNLKVSLILGMLSIILAFTHIYFFLYVNYDNGFSNFNYIGMNGDKIDDWLNCLFYSISLIIPYSLTELIPNTYWMKSISLLQVVLFYVLILKKLSNIFSHNDD